MDNNILTIMDLLQCIISVLIICLFVKSCYMIKKEKPQKRGWVYEHLRPMWVSISAALTAIVYISIAADGIDGFGESQSTLTALTAFLFLVACVLCLIMLAICMAADFRKNKIDDEEE